MNEQAMIEVSGLGKNFTTPGGVIEVLRGVDLKICSGERVAVVGTSGAGKTTLMHILGGLDRPTSGDVFFEGNNLFSLRGAELDAFRNHTVGFVFQFHQLLPEFTALENVMMPLLIGGFKRFEAAEKASAILVEVGLEHRLNHKPGALSGGEQQRVAIARAFATRPKLLFADEPTGNLDVKTGAHINDLLFELNRDAGTTLVLVTHDLSLTDRCSRHFDLQAGRLCLAEDRV